MASAKLSDLATIVATIGRLEPHLPPWELGRNIDGSWSMRSGERAVYLGQTKADAQRSMEAFLDGYRIGQELARSEDAGG